jgi:uncharacterized protein (DUF952 family)/mannose-6-phosphate isomerase-like protein (cupin superfamily)
MPCIIGVKQTVVQHAGITIDELAGNVATKDDTLSIAHVTVAEPLEEPWLNLGYDEWICILKGTIIFLYDDGDKKLEAGPGDTVFIAKGERFKPTFPTGGVEYIPICLPAFRPDRCIREEEKLSEVSIRLKTLHTSATSNALPEQSSPQVNDTLYHMCPKAAWDAAKDSSTAYFPPTFEADGFITHATAVPARLIETANHFYQEVPGEWVCLMFTRSALRKKGIVVRDEEAKPVGPLTVNENWSTWVCPHILGGIPAEGVVSAELPITREGGAFIQVQGV